MRRQTNTINWSRDLPLAQGIRFDLGSKQHQAMNHGDHREHGDNQKRD
jgi:hypothetical protein